MASKKTKLMNLRQYSAYAGIRPATVSALVNRGIIKIEQRDGSRKLVDPANADAARRAARVQVRTGDLGGLEEARFEKLRAECCFRSDRLQELRSRHVEARVGQMVRAEGLKRILGLLDDPADVDKLVQTTAAAGDITSVRKALSTWADHVLLRASTAMSEAAAAGATGAAPAPERRPAGSALADWRAYLLRMEASERDLRLAVARGAIVRRERSLADIADLGVAVRRAVQSIGNAAVEIAEILGGDAGAVRDRLHRELETIKTRIRRLLAPAAQAA